MYVFTSDIEGKSEVPYGGYVSYEEASSGDVNWTSVLLVGVGEGFEDTENEWISSAKAGSTSDLLYWGENTTVGPYMYYGVYEHAKVKYLTAGEYVLSSTATAIVKDPTAVKFVADCLKITPAKADIPAEGAKIEIEEYKDIFTEWIPAKKTLEGDESCS